LPFDAAELLAHIHDAVVASDVNGIIQSWNAGAERVYGYTASEAIGQNISLLYFPEDVTRHFGKRVTDLADAVQKAQALHSQTLRRRHKDGREIFVSLRLALIRDETGEVARFVGCSNDVTESTHAKDALLRAHADLEQRVKDRTRDLVDLNDQLLEEVAERRRMELALRTSEERLQHLLRESPGVLYSCEPADDFAATFTSDNVTAVFGYSVEQFVREPSFWLDHVHPEDREHVLRNAARIVEKGQHSHEYRFLHGDGSYRVIRDSAVAVHDEFGTVIEVVGYCVDITGERHAEQARREQERLHVLAEALLTTQEAERKRISRELHDDLNQRLAVLILEIGLLERDLPAGGRKLRPSLIALKERAAQISDEVRRIALQLHSAGLDQLGLRAALEHECASISNRSPIRVDFRSKSVLEALPEAVSLCLYRVAQECLQNIVRHSKARHAKVTLELGAGGIQLLVEDDGVGFDPKQSRARESLGFISISERVRSVKGTLLIESAAGAGTDVKVHVPLPE